MDDACHYLKERGLQGNHNTVISYQSSMCKDDSAAEVENVNGKNMGLDDMMKFSEESPKLLVWSAADERGILRLQESWKSHFLGISKPDAEHSRFLNDVAHTLSSRRTLFSWRTFAVSRPSESLNTLFDKLSPATQARTSPNLAMIFSGVRFTLSLKLNLY
jgi:hypothetical protein